MATPIPQDLRRGRQKHDHQLPRHDDRRTVGRLTSIIKQHWGELSTHAITNLEANALVVKHKKFVGGEVSRLMVLHEHEQVVLFGVYGHTGERDRLVGHVLLFSGAPITHYYPRYYSLSYSEPTDLKFRQLRILFDDDDVRLLRFGVGTFDYLWLVKKRTEQQTAAPLADHTAHEFYSRLWKEGL